MKLATAKPSCCKYLKPLRLTSFLPLVFALLSTAFQSGALPPSETLCDTLASSHGAVVLRVSGEDVDGAFRVAVRDGQMAVYRDGSTGHAIGIAPRIIDIEGGDVDLSVYVLDDDALASGELSVREKIAVLRAKAGFPTYVPIQEYLRVDIVEIESNGPASSPAGSTAGIEIEGPGETLFPRPGGGAGPCCVTCGTVTVCGCSVNGSCGSCTGDC